jgi:hypothetical protein
VSYRNPSSVLHSVHTGRAAIVDVVDRPLRPQTVVLAFNDFGAPDVCLVIDRTPRDIGELTQHLAQALARMPGAATVIVGTTCVGESAAREVLELMGVDLVDWFLVGSRHALSLAELTDAQSRWLLGARPG